jgi:hypothetical protein
MPFFRVKSLLGVASKERAEHLEIFRDKQAIEKWQAQRLSWPDFYRGNIELTIIGYQKLLHLLREIGSVLFSDIPD